MKLRSWLSLLLMIMLFFITTTKGLLAADSVFTDQAKPSANNSSHAISRAELHQSIQNSQKQAADAQKSIQEFLARPEIAAGIKHAGGSIERVKSQMALLSDDELLNLNRQMMGLDLQKETAGGGAFRVILGLILLALSIYLLVK